MNPEILDLVPLFLACFLKKIMSEWLFGWFTGARATRRAHISCSRLEMLNIVTMQKTARENINFWLQAAPIFVFKQTHRNGLKWCPKNVRFLCAVKSPRSRVKSLTTLLFRLIHTGWVSILAKNIKRRSYLNKSGSSTTFSDIFLENYQVRMTSWMIHGRTSDRLRVKYIPTFGGR